MGEVLNNNLQVANIMQVISSHNVRVKEFQLFCEKLDELKTFNTNEWFTLFTAKPDFAKTALCIASLARANGISIKVDCQSGVIRYD